MFKVRKTLKSLFKLGLCRIQNYVKDSLVNYAHRIRSTKFMSWKKKCEIYPFLTVFFGKNQIV